MISEGCVLSSIRDQQVPASDSGVIVKLNVEQGARVTKGMELARVDDREAEAQKWSSKRTMKSPCKPRKATSTSVSRRPRPEWPRQSGDKLKAANSGKVEKAVSEMEVLRAELEYKKAVLGIEKDSEEHKSNELTADAKKAEVDAADVIVTRRILRAPFDGVVVQVFKREGEWVSPGDAVVQIVRVDRLRISGNLSATDWSPAEIEDRKVTVEVKLPRGRMEKITGKIVYVSPVVFEDQLPIEAEVDTPMDKNGQPLAHAGLPASMTIHVSQPATAEHRPVSAPTRKAAGKGN